MKLLIGSHNPGKIKHWTEYLQDEFEIITLKDLKITADPEETGQTFEKNALLKAKYFSELTRLPTLADDGGFVIDALNGAPGVHTRRWAGYRMTDQELIDYIMEKMKHIPIGKRSAQLRAAVAIYYQGQFKIFASKIKGIVPLKPCAEKQEGFPARTVLYLPEFKKYHVQMTKSESTQADHRKKLVPEIKQYLKIILNF